MATGSAAVMSDHAPEDQHPTDEEREAAIDDEGLPETAPDAYEQAVSPATFTDE
jgi:hypothetical protein